MSEPTLSVVVPCYNEQEVLPETSQRLSTLLNSLIGDGLISSGCRIWFIDDGSRDHTWSIILEATRAPGSLVCGIKLSRNRGHQAALLAGLMTASGDVLISVDADLQDDLNAIPKMLKEYKIGCDIVYGVRNSRSSDTFFKRVTAEGYYKVLQKLGIEVVFNHADYRLLSRRAIEALRSFPETGVFLRGIIPQLGFRSTQVEYARSERFAGESKYPLKKMLALAWQGVTSFSVAPLPAITTMGILVSLASLSMGFWALWVRVFSERALPGWASIVIPIFLLSGVQLLSLGVIGEYIAKVFMETKRRPMYFIEQISQPDEATD
jgi:glycosyltransferase involved in cell wall biosynthesis